MPRDVAVGNGPFFNAASRHRVLASAWAGHLGTWLDDRAS
jgi:hypothetical protein